MPLTVFGFSFFQFFSAIANVTFSFIGSSSMSLTSSYLKVIKNFGFVDHVLWNYSKIVPEQLIYPFHSSDILLPKCPSPIFQSQLGSLVRPVSSFLLGCSSKLSACNWRYALHHQMKERWWKALQLGSTWKREMILIRSSNLIPWIFSVAESEVFVRSLWPLGPEGIRWFVEEASLGFGLQLFSCLFSIIFRWFFPRQLRIGRQSYRFSNLCIFWRLLFSRWF